MVKTADSDNLSHLQRWNFWLAGIFAVVGLAVLFVSASKSLPVYAGYLTPDPVATEITGQTALNVASRHLFDVPVAPLLAAICLVAAVGHGLVATLYRPQYEADLKKRLNKVRWIEYGVTGGLAIALVALLGGVVEFSTLILLLVLTLVMHLLGLLREVHHRGKPASGWLACIIGGIAGVVPWLVIAGSFWATTVFGSGSIPGFVYWLYGSLLAVFLAFAANAYLEFKRPGTKQDYLRTEQRYMLLGAAAKLLLVIQVFRGVL